jgi:hypothetical protein
LGWPQHLDDRFSRNGEKGDVEWFKVASGHTVRDHFFFVNGATKSRGQAPTLYQAGRRVDTA